MVPPSERVRPPLTRYEDLAQMIDHSLVRLELTDDDVIAGCHLARRYGVAGASVRPCDIELALRELQGSSVKVGSVAGFPHGSSTTAVKLYEARDALRRGAREIDMVLNIARLRSRQFQYVESELLQMADACHKEGALLKVIFESAWLTDELKIVACRISVRAGVDFACGAAPQDLRLMCAHLPESIGLKAADVSTLEQAKEVYAAGGTRFGSTATAAILDAWKGELNPA
ncbi:MAG: deoxyribose-phosphate aldolase [Bryobacteraceae bacterium]|jgi:deoxyribose-phosphate aldolase